ncbi:MAG TPA: hypothetical protein VMV92_05610 [Streptosporangiaceae bacterium]|nr:hypothetical protein [Streptosporangiaceae bacterium]
MTIPPEIWLPPDGATQSSPSADDQDLVGFADGGQPVGDHQ